MFYLLALLLASAPLYVIKILNLPVNLLEIFSLAFLLAFAIWIYRNRLWVEFKEHVAGQPRLIFVFAGLFTLSGLIAVGTNLSMRSAGLFIVEFAIPILLYMPASFILAHPLNKIRFIKFLFILVSIYALYGILQYFTLLGLTPEWWGNSQEPKRVISFFVHPNFFALFIAPILALLTPFVFSENLNNWYYKAAYSMGVIGLLLSMSRGGWFGFALAFAVYILVFAQKRIKILGLSFALLAILIIATVPNLRYRVLLPFQGEKSAVSRFSLWHTANKMIEDEPITGKGLYGYRTNFDEYNTDPGLQAHNHPHNLFLALWVETGILGLLSFVSLIAFAFFRAWRLKGLMGMAIILFLIAIIGHGLIDTPYLKNDLALMFWLILALQS